MDENLENLYKGVMEALIEWSRRQYNLDEELNKIVVAEEPSVSTPAPVIRKKRFRTIFTPYQMAALEEYYRRTKYLDRPTRQQLANYLRLPDRQIKVWFQNRRMKDKRCQINSIVVHQQVPTADPQNQIQAPQFNYNIPQSLNGWGQMYYGNNG